MRENFYRFLLNNVIRDSRVQGNIRAIKDFANYLTVEVSDYRFCHKIKRHHKSNNIKIIIDRRKEVYYQKCHDPDHYDFRSETKRLPGDVIRELNNDVEESDSEDS